MPYSNPDEQREYRRLWMARRRAEWIQANGPCSQCGSGDRLEVDHVDPKLKSIPTNGLWSRRAEVRAAELAKCQVLCYGCHKKKTVQCQLKTFEHGTVSMYQKRLCRCVPCRAANAVKSKNWRDRQL